MPPFANGWMILIEHGTYNVCELLTEYAAPLYNEDIIIFFSIWISSRSAPFEILASFAFSSMVTENYLRRTLRLPPTTLLTISSPSFINANISNTRFNYAFGGFIPDVGYTFESSHNAANNNVLAPSDSSSTNTTFTELSSSSDHSTTSSTDTHEAQQNDINENVIEISDVSNHSNGADNNNNEADNRSVESNITAITIINDHTEMQQFHNEIQEERIQNTDRYRRYQNNLITLNRYSAGDGVYTGDIIDCSVCTNAIISNINIVRLGFNCNRDRCKRPRLYHLACLHRWIWQADCIPYCDICRRYPLP